MGLIVGVELGAEGGSFGIEDHSHAIGFMIPQDLEEHGGKTECGVGGDAFGSRQPPNGVKGAEDIRAAIDQKEFLKRSHRLLTEVDKDREALRQGSRHVMHRPELGNRRTRADIRIGRIFP